LNLGVLLRQNAPRAYSCVDAVSKAITSVGCVAVTVKDRNCELQALAGKCNAHGGVVILDLEANLKHEAIAQDCRIGVTTRFKAQPRLVVVADHRAARDLTSTADIRLTGNAENLLALAICETARAPETMTPSARVLCRALTHAHQP